MLEPHFLGVYNMQRVGSHYFPILSLSVPKVVFFSQFQRTLWSLAAFLDATPNSLVKILFISQCRFWFCIQRHQFKQYWRNNKKARVPFSFGPVAFLANLIKFTFLIFWTLLDTWGNFFWVKGSRKLSLFRGKNVSSKPPPVRYLWPKQKKRYLIIWKK